MITHLSISEKSAARVGLKPVALRDLPRIVVCAGPNGSGKTRFLRLINDLVNTSKQAKLIGKANLVSSETEARKMIDSLTANIPNSAPSSLRESFNQGMSEYFKKLEHLQMMIDSHDSVIFSQEALMDWKIAIAQISSSVVDYYAKLHRPRRTQELTDAQISERLEETKKLGLAGPLRGICPYLAYIAKAICHSHNSVIAEKYKGEIEDAQRFNNLLHDLVGTKIGFAIDEYAEIIPTWRGRILDEEELSEGERVLIAWSISMHEQHNYLKSAILFLDEPELYLHPEACIDAIERLKNKVIGEYGQIWIATHSVPLLAHYGVDSIYFVKDGSIERAGSRRIEEVVDSLLGGPAGRAKLSTYLLDADAVAFSHFAVQCILSPGVVDHKPAQAGIPMDKQERQFHEMLRNRISSNNSLRILDFAAGKGRFAAALSEFSNDYAQHVIYYAYNDPSFEDEIDHQDCLRNIGLLSQPGESNQYISNSLAELQGQPPFDVILMVNVLHEIPAPEWLSVLRSLERLLHPEGFLLIMEDLLPPVGELPHSRGYIILDEVGLAHLFACRPQDIVLSKSDDRLLAVSIERSKLRSANENTRIKALEYVHERAKEKIVSIRKLDKRHLTHQMGRQHAHYTMLYTNAHLALADLQ